MVTDLPVQHCLGSCWRLQQGTLNVPKIVVFSLGLICCRGYRVEMTMARSSFGSRISQIMFVSKMTAAILDDLDYIVDASAVSL